MKYIVKFIAHVVFGFYIILILSSSIVTFYILKATDLPSWMSWSGSLFVIVLLSLPYLYLLPGRSKNNHFD